MKNNYKDILEMSLEMTEEEILDFNKTYKKEIQDLNNINELTKLKLDRIEQDRLIAWKMFGTIASTTKNRDVWECITKTRATMQNPLFDSYHFTENTLNTMIKIINDETKKLKLTDKVDIYFVLDAGLKYMIDIINDSIFMLKHHPKRCREYIDRKNKKLNL